MTDTPRPLVPHVATFSYPTTVDARYMEASRAVRIEGFLVSSPTVQMDLPIEYAERLYRQIGDALAASRMPRPKDAA